MLRSRNSSDLRVVFLAGPGDAKAAFNSWAAGSALQDISFYGYSHQLFEVCKSLDVPLRALTTHSNPIEAQAGGISVRRIPDVFDGKHGLAYHAAHLLLLKLLISEVRAFKANLVFLGGEPYPFLLPVLRAMGVKTVMAHHCTLWPNFVTRSKKSKFLFRLQRNYYRKNGYAVLSASNTISRQIKQIAGGGTVPILEFFPTFRKEVFDGIPPADAAAKTFRFTFVGRAEANKGVYDLIEIARRLKSMGRDDIAIDLCGTGSETPVLESIVRDEGLGHWVTLHGWCSADQLREIHVQSHAALVPTRTDFAEGFNQALVEALLSGRPVVTSRVCPAVEYMEGGVVLVEPNDVDGYINAMLRFSDDRDYYQDLRDSSRKAGEKCLDDAHSYTHATRQVLKAALNNTPVKSHVIPRANPLN